MYFQLFVLTHLFKRTLVEGHNNRKPIPQILTDCHENDCLAAEVMRKDESEYNNYLKFEIAFALFLSFPAIDNVWFKVTLALYISRKLKINFYLYKCKTHLITFSVMLNVIKYCWSFLLTNKNPTPRTNFVTAIAMQNQHKNIFLIT